MYPVIAQNAVNAGRELLETGAIYLIVGGLTMLGLVVVLVLIRAAFPVGTETASARDVSGENRMHSTPTLEKEPDPTSAPGPLAESARATGQDRAARMHFEHVNDLMQALQEQGWGQARLLMHTHERARVRLYACEACAAGTGEGCGEPAGFLEKALERLGGRPTSVEETRCGRGSGACDFEVRYAK
jgi:hypothetical protein